MSAVITIQVTRVSQTMSVKSKESMGCCFLSHKGMVTFRTLCNFYVHLKGNSLIKCHFPTILKS